MTGTRPSQHNRSDFPWCIQREGGALWSLGLSKGNRDNIETGALPTLESVSPIEARDPVQDYAELSGFIAEFQLVSSGVESNPATSHPNSTEATCYALSPEHCCKKGGGIVPPTIRKCDVLGSMGFATFRINCVRS